MAAFLQNSWWAMALFGIFIGVFAGLFGLGGGAVLVPLMVLAFQFNQKLAQGTSLAVILSPAAAPAIYKYHNEGFVDWWFVLWVAPFMLVGSYFGAWIATALPQALLKMLFAFVLIYVAGYMVFSQFDNVIKSVLFAAIPAVITVVLALASGVFTQAVKGTPGNAPSDNSPATAPSQAPEGM